MEPDQEPLRRAAPSPALARRLLVAALLVCWEVAPRAGLVPKLFLPPLSEVLAVGFQDRALFLGNLSVTLGEVAVSVLVCCGGGVALGSIVGSVPRWRSPLTTMLSSFYAIPLVILYPLMAAWLGIGPQSKVAFASLYGIVPAVLASAAGIQSIDPQYSLTARSMGATLTQRIVHVVVPAAIPSILSAVRIGASLAIIGVVVAEMLTSTAGIGFLITSFRTVLDSARVFAAILCVLVIAVGSDSVLRLLERRASRWNVAGGER